MTNEEFQKTILNELREFKKETEKRFDSVDQRFDSMDQRLDKVERRLDIITEQTADLLEFRTEVNQKLDQISNDQKSIMQVLGEHEVAIRTLQRRPG